MYTHIYNKRRKSPTFLQNSIQCLKIDNWECIDGRFYTHTNLHSTMFIDLFFWSTLVITSKKIRMTTYLWQPLYRILDVSHWRAKKIEIFINYKKPSLKAKTWKEVKVDLCEKWKGWFKVSSKKENLNGWKNKHEKNGWKKLTHLVGFQWSP